MSFSNPLIVIIYMLWGGFLYFIINRIINRKKKKEIDAVVAEGLEYLVSTYDLDEVIAIYLKGRGELLINLLSLKEIQKKIKKQLVKKNMNTEKIDKMLRKLDRHIQLLASEVEIVEG